MPSKRFDEDFYRDHKTLKNVDFAIGFLLSAALWYFLFKPTWYFAPLVIFIVSMLGIALKIKRRYFIYGALSVVFFPLIVWGGLMIVWAGRGELKS